MQGATVNVDDDMQVATVNVDDDMQVATVKHRWRLLNIADALQVVRKVRRTQLGILAASLSSSTPRTETGIWWETTRPSSSSVIRSW